jgi:hypothetical protein
VLDGNECPRNYVLMEETQCPGEQLMELLDVGRGTQDVYEGNTITGL